MDSFTELPKGRFAMFRRAVDSIRQVEIWFASDGPLRRIGCHTQPAQGAPPGREARRKGVTLLEALAIFGRFGWGAGAVGFTAGRAYVSS
jgi:hypothetical protein